MEAACCELLPWDTEFFGRRIARVTRDRLDEAAAQQILRWCRRERVECLYFLADASDPVTAATAEFHGFRSKDLRVTYVRQLEASTVSAGPALPPDLFVRPAALSDLNALEEIARDSFTDSRFYFDDHFPRPLVSQLYRVWIRQNALGRSADRALVLDHDGKAVGFITCRLLEAGWGEVPLAGLAGSQRGRGLAPALYQAALAWFAEQRVSQVRYVTQGRNVRAQRVLQRLGFLLHSAQVWYHKWFDNEATATASPRLSA